MTSFTPAMLQYWIGDSVVLYHAGQTLPMCTMGIRLLESEPTVLDPHCLYIGEPAPVEHLLRSGRLPEDSCFIISAGRLNHTQKIPGQLTLIETSLPLVTLFNKVQDFIQRFQNWDMQLQQAVYKNLGLQDLLQRAYKELHATIFLVNTAYTSMGYVFSPDITDPIAEEVRQNGYQSFETVQNIRSSKPTRHIPGKIFEYVSPESGNFVARRYIHYYDKLVATLYVITKGDKPNSYYTGLTDILADYVAKFMLSGNTDRYEVNSEFGSLVSDLIEGRLVDNDELMQRKARIKLAFHRYYHVAIATFNPDTEGRSIPWNYLIGELMRIFPQSNATIYQGEILLFIRKTKREPRLGYDKTLLNDILNRYNGHICLGNASEYLTSIPCIYYQVHDALRLARIMYPQERVSYYEDYSIYQIIEYAAETARSRYGDLNLVHLCNNEMISLLLYQKKHGGDLIEFLRAYLLHERNTTETAAALYIHRNTASYKIKNIEEIIGSSLDDPTVRERLLFSLHVCDYVTRYRKEDILKLKRTSGSSNPDK